MGISNWIPGRSSEQQARCAQAVSRCYILTLPQIIVNLSVWAVVQECEVSFFTCFFYVTVRSGLSMLASPEQWRVVIRASTMVSAPSGTLVDYIPAQTRLVWGLIRVSGCHVRPIDLEVVYWSAWKGIQLLSSWRVLIVSFCLESVTARSTVLFRSSI